jgi:hypothetical protein
MIGKTLDHYKVGEQLGRRGMGEVFQADDLTLGRKVALKSCPSSSPAIPTEWPVSNARPNSWPRSITPT